MSKQTDELFNNRAFGHRSGGGSRGEASTSLRHEVTATITTLGGKLQATYDTTARMDRERFENFADEIGRVAADQPMAPRRRRGQRLPQLPLGKFEDVIRKTIRNLDSARNQMDALGVRTRAVTRKLRGVEELPEAKLLLKLPLSPDAEEDEQAWVEP